MPDGITEKIQDIRRELGFLDGDLIRAITDKDKLQAAGWLMEEIETKLAGIEKICQKTSP